MCGIADLDDAGTRGAPAWLGITPKQFKVDNRVGGRYFDKLLEDRSPLDLLHTRHGVHAVEHLLLIDRVAPTFFFSTSDLKHFS